MIKSTLRLMMIVMVFLFVSCNNCTEPKLEDVLYNIWVKYDDNFSDPNTLYSAAELDDNQYGFIIYDNGDFIERKNTGWCGTPPISYGNFNGNWKYISNDTLEINVEFWGGVTTFKIELLSVNQNELIINYIYDYE